MARGRYGPVGFAINPVAVAAAASAEHSSEMLCPPGHNGSNRTGDRDTRLDLFFSNECGQTMANINTFNLGEHEGPKRLFEEDYRGNLKETLESIG